MVYHRSWSGHWLVYGAKGHIGIIKLGKAYHINGNNVLVTHILNNCFIAGCEAHVMSRRAYPTTTPHIQSVNVASAPSHPNKSCMRENVR